MTADGDHPISPGEVAAVSPGSLAHRLGLRPGDELLSVSGHRVRDVIDVRHYGSEPEVRLRVRRGETTLVLEADRQYNEPLGLAFVDPLFDGIRRCDNRCDFCFVAQMPPGLRRSVYVKDDDYRLSFLQGSYVTLTNLTESDWARIEEQHLSPLYVSVHATELDVRRRFLGNPGAPDVVRQLRRLAAMGIAAHTQIVLRPGVNDGRHLDRSIADLAALHPAIRSISVVPVGLTKYHRFACRLHTASEVDDVLQQVSGWQNRLRERLGVGFVYLSDEWYLRRGLDVPPKPYYDELDLTENGVGVVRDFLDREKQHLVSLLSDFSSATIVTGTLFAPVLRAAVAGLGADVVSVVNQFFGESVTVAGLLTAEDIVAQLEEMELGEVVLLPPAMFGGPQGQSLDESWPTDVEQALGRTVVVSAR